MENIASSSKGMEITWNLDLHGLGKQIKEIMIFKILHEVGTELMTHEKTQHRLSISLLTLSSRTSI